MNKATIDFETQSAAGYVRLEGGVWKTIQSGKPGLLAVGAWPYSEHWTTRILILSYEIPGHGIARWLPGDPPPAALFDWIARGGLVEAHNSFFEFSIWTNVASERLGWPPLPLHQLRCSAAKSRAWGLPGALDTAVKALNLPVEKDTVGSSLMKRLSKPKKPTKKEPFEWYTPQNAPGEFQHLYSYCDTDVLAEKGLSDAVPELSAGELVAWMVDQRVNVRGVQCDLELLADCREVVRQATLRYTRELFDVTSGLVASVSETDAIKRFCRAKGAYIPDVQEDTVNAFLLQDNLDPSARRVLEIRSLIGSSSIAKLEAMNNRLGRDGRVRDMFVFCGATRTGRWAGAGVQPQNMVNDHPDVVKCACCRTIQWKELPSCYNCGSTDLKKAEWDEDAIKVAKQFIATRNLDYIERWWGNAVKLVMGVLRSLFVAAPGHDLIGSDFSAIEAVVLAFVAGEQWRMDVFNTHGKIYEMSASKITGVPFDEIVNHKKQTGFDHPLRKTVGKVAELASGYQGWVGAWKAFGADEFMGSDDEIKKSVIAWREASPMVQALWEGLEYAAIGAISNPGTWFHYREISYIVWNGVLHCKLPSGRFIYYHNPRLGQKEHFGRMKTAILFDGVDPKTKQWTTQETHGGKLTENVIQSTSACIQRAFLIRAEASQYWPVIHVHDEGIAEIPEGWGSLEEFEAIMSQRPEWCQTWAIRAGGGWRGKFYRKG